jgi:hypothetical protein
MASKKKNVKAEDIFEGTVDMTDEAAVEAAIESADAVADSPKNIKAKDKEPTLAPDNLANLEKEVKTRGGVKMSIRGGTEVLRGGNNKHPSISDGSADVKMDKVKQVRLRLDIEKKDK